MGYKYQGDATIGASLTVTTPRPLDTRTVVEDINALYDIDSKYAYQGMTVANINDGNLYMLIDKNKINEKAGWKASYESIQIVTCTQEEYNTWAKNTTEDFKPIDGSLTYLRRDVYYYIYEEEENSQYYVTKKQIEDWLKAKASAAEVETLKGVVGENTDKCGELQTQITNLITNINTNYNTSEQIASIYATKEALSETDKKFDSYYTQQYINDTFVTKESLRGGIEEGEGDNFVFVTQDQYNADKETQATALATSVTTAEIITDKITLSEQAVTTGEISLLNQQDETKKNTLLINDEPLAFQAEVPKIQIVTKEYYDSLTDPDPDMYYYLYDDTIIGYISYNTALDTFYTKGQVNTLISEAVATESEKLMKLIEELQAKVTALETPQS